MMEISKSPARVVHYEQLEFAPRFAFPELCEVVEVAGSGDGSELVAGLARFRGAEIPWTVRDDELLLVLEGQFAVETPEGRLEAGPRDTIWLPKGTTVTYIARNALGFYSLDPALRLTESAA